jgi:hypothetical protein
MISAVDPQLSLKLTSETTLPRPPRRRLLSPSRLRQRKSAPDVKDWRNEQWLKWLLS